VEGRLSEKWSQEDDITMIRKAILALLVGSIVLGTAACNTVHGAGKDLESASDSVKDATH
jgi:entericidin B